MKNWRIFWTCSLVEKNGWYYWNWVNWWTKKEAYIFAGYNKKALRNKENTFKDALNFIT